MNPRIKEALIEVAKDNPGIKGKFKMSAGVIFRGKLLSIGVNSYKTHPIMLNGEYKPEQIYLHAEADALIRAHRRLTERQLAQSAMWVVRIKRTPSGGYTEALARPCAGCMALITSYGIKEVEWTTDA